MSHFQFQPKREEDLQILLKEGIGTFEVIKAEEKESKKGDKMAKLLLKCWDCENNQGNIFEYLIFNDNLFSQRKLRHFCYCVGLQDKYEQGKLSIDDFVHRGGTIAIGIQKDKTGQYPDKNSVYDYLKPMEKSNLTSTPLKDLNDSLDDIEF